MKSITEQIKQKRKLLGWSLKDTALKFELTTTGYAKIENGETSITLERLYQIADIFDVSVGQLLGIEGTQPTEEKGELEALKKEVERLQNKLRDVSSEKNLILFGVRSFLLVSKMLVESEVSVEELKETLKNTTEAFSEELEKIKPKGEPPTDDNLPEGW